MKKLFFLLIFIATACHNFKESAVETNAGDKITRSLLLDPELINHTGLNALETVRKFYSSRNFSMMWSDSNGLVSSADSLAEIIRDAPAYGLIRDDYHFAEISELFKDSVSADKFSRLDLLLTDSYLTLHHHLRYGRLDPKTLTRVNLFSNIDEEAIASLAQIGNRSMRKELSLHEPGMVQYQLLKQLVGSLLLKTAPDSIRDKRMKIISINMERWRWETALPDRYVSVNIPAFELRVVEADSVWLRSKVIVGKRETPTPVIESVIRSFTIYPYWHVPNSISTKEILPALQADSSYLRKHNFDVLNKQGLVVDAASIHWVNYSADNFPFILRQREGFENSMGIIKFNFPNNYGIYLHDTNSKRLFSHKMRDLSHGCIRVSQAVAFAHYLVRDDDIYVSPEDLDQYLTLQHRLNIELRKPIPLKLQYFTCEVQNNVPQFYEDIYKKDSVMTISLYRSTTPQVPKPPL